MIEILYCDEAKNASKHFINNFEAFTNHRYRIPIQYITRKAKSLFKMISQNLHPSCMIYRGKCWCSEEQIEERKRNVEKRRSYHNNTIVKHLSSNISHLMHGKFWCLLQKAIEHVRNWKRFILQGKNHHWMSKWSRMFYTFFKMASHEKQHHMRDVFNYFNDFLLYF